MSIFSSKLKPIYKNGLYLAHESSWTRLSGYTPADGQAFDRQYIPVLQGTDAGKRYVVATEQYTIDTTPIEFIESAFSPAKIPGKIIIRDRDGNFQGSGKRTADIIVGTTASGHTAAEVDYLCDGVDDQVEINAAIQALPNGGGKIVIRKGEYNATDRIVVDRDNVTIEGMGNSTVLKNCLISDTTVIRIDADYVKIADLYIDGNNPTYVVVGIMCYANNCIISGVKSCGFTSVGIYIEGNGNKLIGNICNNNNDGIVLKNASGNIIVGNIAAKNKNDNIYLWASSGNIIGGNNFCDFLWRGIDLLNGSNNNIVDGNACFRGTGLTTDYDASQLTIGLNVNVSNNLITNNLILGKNYSNVAGATNTFVNNKYN